MSELIVTEEFLRQVETLTTVLKHNNAGMFGGNRKSKTYGSSCEFADYRDYVPGDDITKIDWNAYARFDKLYQKLYLDERQMHTRIYIDASRSMAYNNAEKGKQCLRLAATLAYMSLNEMEKVSIYTIRENEITEVVTNLSGKNAYYERIGLLNDIEFTGDCCISDAILPARVGRGDGLTVLISDFLTDNDYETAIDKLTDCKRDILCIQVMGRDEMNPQLRGKMHLFDAERESLFYRKNIDRDIINAYKAALQWATNRLREYCMARGADYMLVVADQSMSEIFFEKLVNAGVLK